MSWANYKTGAGKYQIQVGSCQTGELVSNHIADVGQDVEIKGDNIDINNDTASGSIDLSGQVGIVSVCQTEYITNTDTTINLATTAGYEHTYFVHVDDGTRHNLDIMVELAAGAKPCKFTLVASLRSAASELAIRAVDNAGVAVTNTILVADGTELFSNPTNNDPDTGIVVEVNGGSTVDCVFQIQTIDFNNASTLSLDTLITPTYQSQHTNLVVS